MAEHNHETVHHGVHVERADGDCWGTAAVVGFRAHRMQRAAGFTGAKDGWTFTDVGPVRATHEAAWQDMWDAGDAFHGTTG